MAVSTSEGWTGILLGGAACFIVALLFGSALEAPENMAKAEAKCELSVIQSMHKKAGIDSMGSAYQVVLCMRQQSFVLDDTNPMPRCGVASFVERSTAPLCYAPASWEMRQMYYAERKWLPRLIPSSY